MLEEKDMAKILNLATQMLKWNLPMLITEDHLAQIKIVASYAITRTHSQLSESISPVSTTMINLE